MLILRLCLLKTTVNTINCNAEIITHEIGYITNKVSGVWYSGTWKTVIHQRILKPQIPIRDITVLEIETPNPLSAPDVVSITP